MSADRVRGAALTEAVLRIANERMARWEERHRDGAQELYLCECAMQACREHVSLTREQYEAVRGDLRHFLVVPGHVFADLEFVVQSFSRYEVIEKPSALMDLLVATDPRQARSGEAPDAARTLARSRHLRVVPDSWTSTSRGPGAHGMQDRDRARRPSGGA